MPLYQTCPKCAYDLTGLTAKAVATCPECGSSIENVYLDERWNRAVSRRWTLFLLSPLIGVPGLLLLLIGYPICVFVLSVIFAYRAFALEERVKGGTRVGPFFRLVQTGLLALVWTCTSMFILWGLVIAVMSLVLDRH